jgi:hypothetical protein
MDTGRLNSLLSHIADEVKTLGLTAQLQKFHQAFSQSVTQPNQPMSTAFISTRAALWELLASAASDQFPPSYRKMMDKMNATRFLGKGLRTSLEEILAENTMTPGQAVEQVAEFNKKAQAFYTLADSTHSNLKQLKIEYSVTSEEEYEIGALFPADLFKNNVEGLEQELHLLDRHLRTFGEMAGQDTRSPTIRVVASGTIEVFVNALPDVAAAIGDAIEKIVLVYLSILQIRQLRDAVKKKQMPDELVKLMDKHEKDTISAEIDKIADEIFEKHRKKAEKHRDKELRGRLIVALKYIAKRLDGGADFEVTPPSVEPEIAADAADDAKTKHQEREELHKTLRLRGAAMMQLPMREQPILALPEPGDEQGEEPKPEP